MHASFLQNSWKKYVHGGFLVILPRDLLKLQLQGQLSVTIEVNSAGWDGTSKPLAPADHAITAQTLFKQLIVRQRRRRHTFCGRYEQTVNDVYLRLPRAHHQRSLPWKEKEPAEKRNKGKNKRKAIQHFSHLVYIVVCLFVGCAGGVEECCV